MSDDASPASPMIKNIFWAFISGGIICTIGQFLISFYQNYCGLNLKDSRAAVSVTLVGAGALLTALRVYDNIVNTLAPEHLFP